MTSTRRQLQQPTKENGFYGPIDENNKSEQRSSGEAQFQWLKDNSSGAGSQFATGTQGRSVWDHETSALVLKGGAMDKNAPPQLGSS
ncbi:hypothetical protein QL285_057773 [Trifolium repens]|nr:hypothetical protein QL285_057773 [Trifolium repens]